MLKSQTFLREDKRRNILRNSSTKRSHLDIFFFETYTRYENKLYIKTIDNVLLEKPYMWLSSPLYEDGKE